ncbi:MAG: glycosyltransferase family 2 protein [Afipia sp.]|nr:glycosyltransferase family 2 protein [Afipia sp.]
MKTLTILIPALNEELNLPTLRRRLESVFAGLKDKVRPEYIVLDNCSEDSTPQIAERFCLENSDWKYVRYSRNFGYHGSLAGGFDLASGDALIVVAGDLQEPPEMIPLMVDLWQQGNDVVYGILQERNDSNLVKTVGAKVFYSIIYRMSSSPLPNSATDFRLISRRVIDVVKNMREPDRYLRGLVHWAGFKQSSFLYNRDKRIHGKSTAGIWYSTKWAVNAIISFSNLPLRAAAFFGLIAMIVSLLATVYFVIVHFFPPAWMPIPPTGTTAIIVLLLFAIGLNAFFLGIIGEYVVRIYTQSKKRPLYVIDKVVHLNR